MTALRAKFRAELLHWLWSTEHTRTDDEIDTDDYDAFERELRAWACAFVGAHEPERDQCNIPDHDYCLWCFASTPGEAH